MNSIASVGNYLIVNAEEIAVEIVEYVLEKIHADIPDWELAN
ncbi:MULTISPECIES: hypothetical protein [Bacillus]|nr:MULTISPECIES: hypothetical protein [Bacillus]